MPQAEKLKLKEESKVVETEEEDPVKADHKILVRQIHEAYIKNFNMNKAKARLILTGKTSQPVNEEENWTLFIASERYNLGFLIKVLSILVPRVVNKSLMSSFSVGKNDFKL